MYDSELPRHLVQISQNNVHPLILIPWATKKTGFLRNNLIPIYQDGKGYGPHTSHLYPHKEGESWSKGTQLSTNPSAILGHKYKVGSVASSEFNCHINNHAFKATEIIVSYESVKYNGKKEELIKIWKKYGNFICFLKLFADVSGIYLFLTEV